MTSTVKASASDVFHTDHGDLVYGDVKVAAVDHPPFLKASKEAVDMKLWDLTPPDSLVSDWVKQMVERVSIPEAWENTNYEERYMELLSSNEASESLKRLDMMNGRNDVVIACNCSLEMYYFCPRRLIYEKLTGEGTLRDRLLELQ